MAKKVKQMNRKITKEDLFDFVRLKDPQFSPDGDKVAFVATRTSLEENNYKTNIWLYDRKKEEIFPLTGGENDQNPRWSPNGEKLLFLARRGYEEEEEGQELWIMDADKKGEATKLISRDNGIKQPRWSPHGDKILFLSRAGEKGEVQEIERIPIWYDGQGFTHYSPTNIFEINPFSGRVTQLTHSETDIQSATYSNSGEKIAYVSNHTEIKPHLKNIAILSKETGEKRTIVEEVATRYPVSWGVNNEKLLFTGHKYHRGLASHNDLWFISVNSGEMENLTKNLPKNIRGGGAKGGPSWRGNHIYFIYSDGGKNTLQRYNIQQGETTSIVNGKVNVNEFAIENGDITYFMESHTKPIELFIRSNHEEEKQISSFNQDLIQDKNISPPEKFSFKASDEVDVEGWYIKPEKAEETEVPLILKIHGGPKGKYGWSFYPEYQYYADQGYGMIFMNPRGSDGYTEEFADVQESHGERDFQDLMEGIDYAIEQYDWIDEERMGVTGISYGGFMTNWIITHTNRFKAAITEESVSNRLSSFGTADIGFYFTVFHMGGDPWTNLDEFLERSAILHVESVDTPTLIIHAQDDYRCWVDQAIQLFTALKYHGKETKFLLFPVGSHGISRTGKPEYRLKRLKEMTKWFDKYLKAKE